MKMLAFLSGIGLVACVVGLLLLGFALGAAVSLGAGLSTHMLFKPWLISLGAGILVLLMMAYMNNESGI